MEERNIKPYNKSIIIVEKCISHINKIETFEKHWISVFSDLLNRILWNCRNLNDYCNNRQYHLTIRLLQRSIIEDLIVVFFFLSLADEKEDFDAALDVLNVQSKKSLEKWLEIHYEIDKANSGQGENYITKEEYLKEYNDYCDNTITHNDKTCAKLIKGTFTGNISQMEELTKGTEVGKAIHYLYAEYRFLSQVEHYCFFNRGYSYCHKKDNTIDTHRKVIEFCIRYLYETISCFK